MLNISERQTPPDFALFDLGFRPFFLGAAMYAVLATLVWMGIYVFGWNIQLSALSVISWHAHEMIFGFSVAVVAGFLLTATSNWTNSKTLHGMPLLFLFILWVLARILPFVGGPVVIELTAIIDNLFILLLILAISIPVIKAGLWQHLGIVLIPVLMLGSNLLFYAGVLGFLVKGVNQGLYAGLYLLVLLIFVMAGRVLPFFIEKGVGYPLQLKNWKWLDVSSLLVFFLFALVEIFVADRFVSALLAGILFLLHGARMAGWYTHGIWRKPLLWVLYLAYGCMVFAFLLKLAVYVFGISPYLAIHAFAFGGIGLITIGMMSRISLGHTGRNVLQPPRALFWAFLILALGMLFRVILPLLLQTHYALWIALAMACWIIAFAMFFYIYLPILLRPEINK